MSCVLATFGCWDPNTRAPPLRPRLRDFPAPGRSRSRTASVVATEDGLRSVASGGPAGGRSSLVGSACLHVGSRSLSPPTRPPRGSGGRMPGMRSWGRTRRRLSTDGADGAGSPVGIPCVVPEAGRRATCTWRASRASQAGQCGHRAPWIPLTRTIRISPHGEGTESCQASPVPPILQRTSIKGRAPCR